MDKIKEILEQAIKDLEECTENDERSSVIQELIERLEENANLSISEGRRKMKPNKKGV